MLSLAVGYRYLLKPYLKNRLNGILVVNYNEFVERQAEIKKKLQQSGKIVITGAPNAKSVSNFSVSTSSGVRKTAFSIGESNDCSTYSEVKGFLRELNPAINPELLGYFEPTQSVAEDKADLVMSDLTEVLLSQLDLIDRPRIIKWTRFNGSYAEQARRHAAESDLTLTMVDVKSDDNQESINC